MEDNTMAAKVILTGLIAAGSALWGWFGWLLILWLVCMAMDYLTGTLAALRHGDWSSAAARDGLWHKGGEILVVCAAALTDLTVTLLLRSGVARFPFDHSVAATALVLAWYTLTELGSMLENATKLTDRVPAWLTKFLSVTAATVEALGDKLSGGKNDEKQP